MFAPDRGYPYAGDVFYTGEFVRSRLNGLGEVLVSGEDAEVRFLDGRRLHVAGSTLTRIPPWKFERAEANLMAIERWLDLHMNGVTSRPAALMPRPSFDLETAMRRHARGLHSLSPRPVVPSVVYLFDDSAADGLAGYEAPPRDHEPIHVEATRWAGRYTSG